jgi:hypothetical protein
MHPIPDRIRLDWARRRRRDATGAPIRFGDRVEIEVMVEKSKSDQYGLRTLVLHVVGSDLLRDK